MIISSMVYVILVQVLVLFLMSFRKKLCMKLLLVNFKILMFLFSLPIERPSFQLVLSEVLCGKTKYHVDFLVLGKAASKTCPIIFGRPFLNTFGAIIDCKKENFFTKFDADSYEFNFS